MTTARSPTPYSPDSGPRTTTARDPWFDNAKMLLVLLVVVGHSWTLLPETAFNSRVYDYLYLWHIPAFVMVTGYLSRTFTYSKADLRRLVTMVALPYVVFEAALAAFRVYVGGEHLERLWLNPHWPMWYLAALFAWRLLTPLLKRLPPRQAILLAVVVSLLGGFFSLETFDLNRALALLPFFAIGALAQPQHIAALRSWDARAAAVPVLVAAIWFTGVIESDLATEWLYWRAPYAETDFAGIHGALIRLLFLGVALVMSLSLLAWIPEAGGWFSRLGSASLVVYLFHGFFIRAADYAGFEDWAQTRPLLAWTIATFTAGCLACALAAPPVARRLSRVVTPVR